MLRLINHLNSTTLSEWYVLWCGFKNGHQKDTCFKEIGLHAQNMITISGTVVNLMGRGGWPIWPSNEH